MDNTVKTLIIVVIILVAILGVVGGVFLQSYLSNNKNDTVVNQTNISVNNSSNNSTSSSTTSTSGYIGSQRAGTIALKYGKEFEPDAKWSVGSVGFVQTPNFENTPFYMVELSNNAPYISGVPRAMDVRVNAKTGSIMN